MAEAALATKPKSGPDKAPKAAPETEAPVAGVPAYLGGVAAGAAPAYLQRLPADPLEDQDEGTLQRMPQDPFPSIGDEEDEEDVPQVQAKLVVNQPGDKHEREADRIADAAVNGGPGGNLAGSAPTIQRKCETCGGDSDDGGTCPNCAAKLQRKGGADAPRVSPQARAAVASPGSGAPLSDGVRGRIEPALGHDLSGVRVHSDSRANEAASSINAKAFTHGNHIWLGPGESTDDVALMAHEATHTVQQTEGGAPQLIQRAPSDHLHPEDGEGPRGRMHADIENEVGDDDPPDEKPEVDPAEKNAKSGSLEGQAKPDTNRPANEAPKVDQAAAKVEAEADKPGEPIAEGDAPKEDGGEAAADGAEAELGAVAQALAEATALPEPSEPAPLPPPAPVAPVNKDGEPVVPDFETEARIQVLAGQIQAVRQGAHAMKLKARQEKANAALMRGNIALVDQHVAEAETGLTDARGQMEYRATVADAADAALKTSEEKADKVAADAPGFESEAEEAQGESGPMASEASDTAADNASNTPDDPDAAADSAEAGGSMNKVSSDAASMDQAAGATKARAVQLQADAAEAKTKNAETKGRIEETRGNLEQTGARITEMDGEAATARGEIDGLKAQPDVIDAEAVRIDGEADAVIGATEKRAAALEKIQQEFQADIGKVAGTVTLAKENEGKAPEGNPQTPADAGAPAQEAPAGAPQPERTYQPAGYEGRQKVDLTTALFGQPALTEKQKEKMAKDKAAAEAKRKARIAEIEAMHGGDFSKLSAMDKAGIALGHMRDDLFGSVSNIGWPDFSWQGLGKALINVFNPLGPLEGVLGGLSQVASGVLNLFDMDQWAKDPLGNLLKSAADIATGITAILASIIALLGVVMAIAAAVIVVTFGWATPAMMPIISFCGSATITVGGWTISVGLLALYYQSLLFIKNLVDAMTAETAEELVIESEQMTDDVKQAGEVAMHVGTAALSRMGGAGMMDEIGQVGAAGVKGSADDFARAGLQYGKKQTFDNLKDAAIEGSLGEQWGGLYGTAKMAHGLAKGGVAKMKGGDSGAAPKGGDDAAAPKADGADAKAPDTSPADRTPDAPEPPKQTAPEPVPDTPPPPDALPPRSAAEAPAKSGGGDVQKPSIDMDAPPPDRPKPKDIDTAKDSADADATGGTKEGGDAPAAPEAKKPDAESDMQGPKVPKLDAPEGGTDAKTKPSDSDGPAKKAADPDQAKAKAEDGADQATKPADGASKPPDPAADKAARERAKSKKLETLSPDERAAEARQANSTPKVDIEHKALKELGFDKSARLDNGMEYITSKEKGAFCRIANNGCGPTDGDNVPENNTGTDQGLTDQVNQATGEGARQKPDGTPDTSGDPPPVNKDRDGDTSDDSTTKQDTSPEGDPKDADPVDAQDAANAAKDPQAAPEKKKAQTTEDLDWYDHYTSNNMGGDAHVRSMAAKGESAFEKHYRDAIDAAGKNSPQADALRYERHLVRTRRKELNSKSSKSTRKPPKTKDPVKWENGRQKLSGDSKRGMGEKNDRLAELGITDNDTAPSTGEGVMQFPTMVPQRPGSSKNVKKTTRPDGVTDTHFIESKSIEATPENRANPRSVTVDETQQTRAQRLGGKRGKPDGKKRDHAVFVITERADPNNPASPLIGRPSKTLGRKGGSKVIAYDRTTQEYYQWDPNTQNWSPSATPSGDVSTMLGGAAGASTAGQNGASSTGGGDGGTSGDTGS